MLLRGFTPNATTIEQPDTTPFRSFTSKRPSPDIYVCIPQRHTKLTLTSIVFSVVRVTPKHTSQSSEVFMRHTAV
jgi:hypothetical protein